MSLILDALNKSDRDAKHYGAAPSIDANHGVPVQQNQQLKILLLGIIALLFLVSVVLLTTIAFKSPDQTPLAEATPAALPTLPVQSTAQAPATPEPTKTLAPSPPKPESPPANPPNEEVIALYATEVTTEEIPIHIPKVVAPAPTVTNEDQALAQFLWEKTKIQPLPTAPQATPPTAASDDGGAEAAPPPKNSIHRAEDVPFLHRLPLSLQNRIPSLMYAKHNYAEGYVIINKKRLNVGDYAASGVAVESILEDGVIFSFDEKRFKLAAQSSWVNY